MKRAAIGGLLAAVGLTGCGITGLQDAIKRECLGPAGVSAVWEAGKPTSAWRGNGVEVLITCQNGTKHQAAVE
jgi:hypothetical protein